MKTDIPVIRTKIIIPQRRREIISRPRLLNILHDILELKLLILAAPAGYGKTSLLVDFSKHSQLPMCWLALDPLDNDLKRFTTHLIASIHHRFNDFGDDSFSVLATMNQDSVDMDPIVSAIINDVYDHISEHFVVVLDDYHLVRESKEVEAFINRVILEIGENVHFIIASRTLLTLPDLSLLVARSQVGGLSFEELAFLPDEIRELLETNYHQEAADSKIKELLDQTEGWITGLLLSTQLSQKGVDERQRVAKVSGIGIYEYLAQQVFDRQPADVRKFMLRTSLLEEFDAEMCEKMLAPVEERTRADWQVFIDRVLNDNLFVLQVGEGTVYLRFHHLFRDFLQNRMRLERPEETEKIEKTLAAYLKASREWERAYAIYARLGDIDQIADLIHEAGPDLIAGGRLVTLSTWLDDLPQAVLDSRADLKSILGSIFLIRGNPKASLDYYNQAIAGLQQHGSRSDLAYSLARRSAALRQTGEYAGSMADAEAAIRLSSSDPRLAHPLAEALRSKGILLTQEGKPQEALDALNKAAAIYRKLNKVMDEAKVLLDLGLAYRKIGYFEETQKAYTDALKILQKAGNAVLSANIHNNLGVLQYLLGQYDKAISSLDNALQYAKIANYPRLEGYTLNSIGDLYRDLGAYQQARDSYDQAWEAVKSTPDRSLELYQYLSLTALERMAGNYRAANDYLVHARTLIGSKGNEYEFALCSLESAVLQLRQQKREDILVELQKVHETFAREGHLLEADKSELLMLIASDDFEAKQKTKKIAMQLFSKTISDTSIHSLLLLGIEFKDQLQQIESALPVDKDISGFVRNVIETENKIPDVRKSLRGKTAFIPNTQAHIVIRALGRIQIKVGEHPITTTDWKTQTSRDFFLYLLAHPDGATKEEIAEIFWPYGSAESTRLRFKNTIYRVRRAVGADCVSYIDDFYRFNRSVDYESDAEDFMSELNAANAADTPAEQIKHLKAAINTYHGPFLPKLDMEWALVLRTQLQHAFMDAVIKLANLYFQADLYQPAIHAANRALVEDPCNEAAHRLIMLAYAAIGSRADVARQYEKCKMVLLSELNVEPAQQTTALYEMLMR